MISENKKLIEKNLIRFFLINIYYVRFALDLSEVKFVLTNVVEPSEIARTFFQNIQSLLL